YDKKIYESDPFAHLDQNGVGKLVAMAAKLGRVLGLGVGISSGANFLGAVLQNREPGRQVATVFADDSKKYLTTLLATPPAETTDMVTARIELLGYEPVEVR
ncbi:MAG: hypothetical protein EGQ09_19435, partial [Clostridiales bacterium]|nr:hypothetical protein [Clostridiales bacterium]